MDPRMKSEAGKSRQYFLWIISPSYSSYNIPKEEDEGLEKSRL